MEAVVLSSRFVHRVSVPTLWICFIVLFGSLKESNARFTFVEEPQDTAVVLGDPVSLNCTGKDSIKIKYYWQFKGSKIVTDSRVIVQSDGTLHITNAGKADSGDYVCVAVTKPGGVRTKSKSRKAILTVQIFPTITTQPKDTLANENAKVRLDCTVDSSPPAKVTWSVNGHGVKLDSNHKINSNNALVFKKISLGDAGFYRCIVSHPGNTVISQEANVTVLGSVRLADYIINHHKFDKGSTAKLHCSFKGSGPISVKWKKIGAMSMSKRVVSKDGTLTINDIDMEDEGIYTCIGSNLFSNVSARITISLFIYPKFIVKPKNTTAVEFDSVWLHCNATGYPKPKINWGKEEHGGDVLDEERFHVFKNGTLYIENVRAKDQGRYYCIAGNIANFIQVTISLRVVMDPADL